MKRELSIVATLGAIGILLGAFGAHGLEDEVTPEKLASFETGVRYLMYHVLASVAILATSLLETKLKLSTTRLFLAGIVLFSGSIFLLVAGIPAKFIWFLTPLGGVVFAFAWLRLAYLVTRSK